MTLQIKYKSLFEKYGLTTKLRISHFMAQIHHESGLKPISENLNYSYDRLLVIFKSDFDTDKNKALSNTEKAFAETIAKKPILIGNFVYANQNGNGSISSGDGYKYRGRGFIQITGRSNYAELSKDTGIDFINNPDLLLIEANALISALWFWNKKGLNAYADKNAIVTITKRINGGTNGIDDRKRLFEQYFKK